MTTSIGDLSIIIQRNYNDGMWLATYIFKNGTFFRMFWCCDFIMIWCWWFYMLTLFITMHSFISELGRTSVQWWSGSERNYGSLMSKEGHSSERNRRHGKISNIPLIPQIWYHMHFEKELVALAFAFTSLSILLFYWVWTMHFITRYYYPDAEFHRNICKIYSHPFFVVMASVLLGSTNNQVQE